jgi:hypothetical protein
MGNLSLRMPGFAVFAYCFIHTGYAEELPVFRGKRGEKK